MKKFFGALLSASDPTADSIIAGGILSIVALIGFTGYQLVTTHHFSGPDFAGAASALIGAMGVSKRIRDGQRPQQPGG